MPDTVKLYETPEELNTLHTATEVKTLSDKASEIHEVNAVARLINLAANSGQSSAVWNHPISESLKATLESNGYEVKCPKHAVSSNRSWIISWEK